jgi:hypothetical protein
VDEVGQAQVDLDRLDLLEDQVRQLTGRLAGWVEAQLVQAIDERRDDLQSLRAELQLMVSERVAGLRTETIAVQSLASRLEARQAQLSGRLEHLAEQAAGFAQMPAAAEALEQRVRSAMSRLSDSVEARLIEVDRARQAEFDALQVEVQALAEGRITQAAESARGLANADERLVGLARRLDEVAGRVDTTAEDVTALRTDVDDAPGRLEAFEQRVKAAMGRLTDSVEARLAETAAARDAGLAPLEERLSRLTESVEAQVAEAAATQTAALEALGHRLDALERQVQAAAGEATDAEVRLTDRLDAVSQRHAGTAHEVAELRSASEELEKRVKAAVGRLAESVEGKLAGLAEKHATDVRTEIDAATGALRARFGQVHDRIGALEQEQKTVGAAVEAKVGEVVERRRAEFLALRQELDESVAAQIREGRQEIAVAVADAHRRFVVSVDRLEERMNTVAEQSTAAWAAVAGLETMQETVASDGRRIEALEVHTRRTDARLGDVVDAKVTEIVDPRIAQIDAALAEGSARLDARQAALDEQAVQAAADLDTRRAALDEQAARAAADLDARRAALDEQAAHAVESLEALSASVQAALDEAQASLTATVDGRLSAVEAAAADRDAGAASLGRRLTRIQEGMRKSLAAMTEQIEAAAAAARRDAGALAPLRSDVRALQGQVAELTELVADLRPKRKAAAGPAPTSTAGAARARKAAALLIPAPGPSKPPPPPPALVKQAPKKKAAPAAAKKAPRGKTQ